MQIKELKIYSTRIKEQSDFYSQVMGLKVIKQSEKEVTLEFGNSILRIAHRNESTPYHFAINIPANKEIEALNWLKSRVKILKDGDMEIQDFDFWNAKAIYFYDLDKNIVELIARKNLKNSSYLEFDSNQFLEISEIGLPTFDIEKEYRVLNDSAGMEVYDGAFDRFCAVGDEHGLFICINKKIKDWFPTDDKAFSSEFEIRLVNQENEYQFEYVEEELRVL